MTRKLSTKPSLYPIKCRKLLAAQLAGKLVYSLFTA